MNDKTLKEIEAVADSLSFAAGKCREEGTNDANEFYQNIIIDLFDKLETLMLEE